MSKTLNKDREMLMEMSQKKLLNLFFLHIRNIWRVDGLYFLGIEEKFGTDAATDIDANCWKIMGKIEARALKKTLEIEKINPATLIYLLRNTSWALDIPEKESEVTPTKAIFRVTKCGTQETRIRKGLNIFPCKKVRFGYLKSFAKELNPTLQVICKRCPPDKPLPNLWCEWEFTFKKSEKST